MKSRITIAVVVASLVSVISSPVLAQKVPTNEGKSSLPFGIGDPLGLGDVIQEGKAARECQRLRLRPCHYWVTAESLLWFGTGRSMPALVTTSPQGTVRDDAGVLGEPGTQVLFGGGNVGDGLAAGARIDFGFWLDPSETLGVGAKVWGLQGENEGYFASGADGNPILARPFYNVLLDREDSQLVVFPGLLDTGSVDVETSSDIIGSEVYLRTSMMAGRGYNLDLMGGYNFVRLQDKLQIHSNSVNSDAGGFVPVGTIFDVTDSFDTRNEFHGGQIGVVSEIRYDSWTVSGLAKVSVGNMHQVVNIDGSTVVTPPAVAPTTSDGGLLALPTNMSSTAGPHSRDRTAFIPEIGFNVAYKWREHVRLNAGYSAVYMSRVALAGDQIDRNINPTQIGGGVLIGPPLPAFEFNETEYWMHGLNLGVTLIY